MGYILSDNRASGGEMVERDTQQCPHCQRHLLKPLRKETGIQTRGAFCSKCMKAVCDMPPCNTRCEPFFRRIDHAIRRDAFARAAGLQGG